MSQKKVLVVEDEVLVRLMLDEVFQRAGYTVRAVESAEEAISILEQENIQVMFLDLSLPGMNGLELCKEIRKNKPLTVIYAVTGHPSLYELADCREAGFDDYFNKPVPLNTLVKAAEDGFKKRDRWKQGRYPIGAEI